MSVSVRDLPRLEELLSEDEYLHLRYLACHLVSEHISNEYGVVAYVVYNVLRSWGYDAHVLPAIKRIRTVATVEDSNNFFNPKFTDADDKHVNADVALVCVTPCKIVDDDNPDQAPLAFGAITDLFMTPELDLPIYSMHKRNALSPLATVPEIRVAQYALLGNHDDPTCRALRSRMKPSEREQIDYLASMFRGEEPGAAYMMRVSEEKRAKAQRLIRLFAKPFSDETRPNEGFFRFFQLAMNRVKQLGEYNAQTNTLTIKKQVSEQEAKE